MWERTVTTNPYTGLGNWAWDFGDGSHCLVFMRQQGWAFTVRLPTNTGGWIQESSGSSQYFRLCSHAQEAALSAAKDIKSRLADRISTKTYIRVRLSDQDLKNMGLNPKKEDKTNDDDFDFYPPPTGPIRRL